MTLDLNPNSNPNPPITDNPAAVRDAAVGVAAAANDNWIDTAVAEFTARRREVGHTFTGEDIRLTISPFVGPPKSPHAWGALVKTLNKRGLIAPTGEYRPMRVVSSHGRETKVYIHAA